ncbi:MAG: hypothetical protein R6V05_15480 [Candidatus Brocadiia bacterium]
MRKLHGSQSLFEVGEPPVRLYLRYSRVHNGGRTFYGLREQDLARLGGHPSILCFLWDAQEEPLLIPYGEVEEVFEAVSPASDGQYKAQVYLQEEGNELYVARAGRFSVEAYGGWETLVRLVAGTGAEPTPELSHDQVQTLLGSIGSLKNCDVWLPRADRKKLDWSLAQRFPCSDTLPPALSEVDAVAAFIDVIWLRRGTRVPVRLFEVEHTTPVYGGLLRLNDVYLSAPQLETGCAVVAERTRKSVFVRQVNRPTFKASGLNDRCAFLDYREVYCWHKRLTGA